MANMFTKPCPVCGNPVPITLDDIVASDGQYKAPCINCGFLLIGVAEVGIRPGSSQPEPKDNQNRD